MVFRTLQSAFMPRELLFDIGWFDPSRPLLGREDIRRYNPHRGEMEHIDGVLAMDVEAGTILGWKDVRPDEFWVPGHIPGRPILPAVIMLEAAAQLCSVVIREALKDQVKDLFIGFGGIDNARFRGLVQPGDRLLILAKRHELKRRIAVFDSQGVVGDKIVFEARIIGVPV